MSLFEIIKQDLKINSSNGLLCKLMLIDYRIGSSLIRLKTKNRSLVFIVKLALYCLKNFIHNPLSVVSGSFIPYSCIIGRNVCFRHSFYGIFISQEAIIGDNAVILHQVTIGSNHDTSKNPGAPKIGNNVFVGAGAKVIGKIVVGNDCRVGANAVVVHDMADNSTCVMQKCNILTRKPE